MPITLGAQKTTPGGPRNLRLIIRKRYFKVCKAFVCATDDSQRSFSETCVFSNQLTIVGRAFQSYDRSGGLNLIDILQQIF